MCRVILLTCLDIPVVHSASKIRNPVNPPEFHRNSLPALSNWDQGGERKIFVIARHKTKFWYPPNVNNIITFFVFKTS